MHDAQPHAWPLLVLLLLLLLVRAPHLVYNGSIAYWHAARPLQVEQLRQHLLPWQERVCQVRAAVPASSAAVGAPTRL